MKSLRGVIEEFDVTIRESREKLLEISDARSAAPLSPGKWSRKEVLGHLIDSAGNNHQRFVRAQLSSELSLPGYEQDAWVKCQGYRAEAWTDLVALWTSFNLHLLHVVSGIPPEKLDHRIQVGSDAPVTLHHLIGDYLRHLKHHLDQITGR